MIEICECFAQCTELLPVLPALQVQDGSNAVLEQLRVHQCQVGELHGAPRLAGLFDQDIEAGQETKIEQPFPSAVFCDLENPFLLFAQFPYVLWPDLATGPYEVANVLGKALVSGVPKIPCPPDLRGIGS